MRLWQRRWHSCTRFAGPRTPRLPTGALAPLSTFRDLRRGLEGRSEGTHRIACASIGSGRNSTTGAEIKLRKLKQKLKKAIEVEDYAEAASLRDEIEATRSNDPVLRLKVELEDAIQAQDFEVAARCRDELLKLAPEPKPRVPSAPPPPTTSDTITNDVRIQVKSSFLPHRSAPGSFFFTYRIRIRNESDVKTIKLHSRHWIITDANFHQDIVRGLGVIGEQPELAPGEEHVYSSFCPLRTPTGKMKGSFRMQVKNESGEWSDDFDADIGVFGLDMSDATPAKW